MSRGALGLWVLGAGLGVIVYWGWLAVRRAKATDPVRPRREARDRIARTLALLPPATGGDRTALLLTWQRDVATLWQVAAAVPRPTAFSDPQWARLWTESDRALYAGDATLPADWVPRAQEAIAAKAVPGFQPLRLFLPQNLMPFAAGVTLLLLATNTLLEAAEPTPVAAYQSGGFAAAEKAWRARLASVPTDWIARHNLSLALAQQERPAESAAQAAAAFVQQPGNTAVRWHFGHSIERSGFASPTLAAFLNPSPRHTLAREASPATWQHIVILAAFTAALALGGLLWNVYGPRRAGIRWTAVGLFILASAGSVAAISSLLAYGTAASTSAVVVARAGTLRSIPTEADTAQKTSPLAPGALALTDLSFLNGRWIRLVFENGQTGWVRKDDVVPLWK